jgi:hypothetical protein
MQLQESFLKAVVCFDDTVREPHAESIEPRREQTIELLEDPVLAASVAFHEDAQSIAGRIHRAR